MLRFTSVLLFFISASFAHAQTASALAKTDDNSKVIKSDKEADALQAAQSKTEKYLSDQKNRALKKRLADEQKQFAIEARDEERKNKLDELRNKYLNEYLAAGDRKIVPERKYGRQFLTTDIPPPLMSRVRVQENLHIPIIITDFEKAAMMFRSVSLGRLANFNALYKELDNPDTNLRNGYGDTVLTYATLLKRYEIMGSILGKGADPDNPNALGYTPLNIAIEMSDYDAAKILVDNGADYKGFDKFGRTYLMHATRVGTLPIVDLLVRRGADVNAVDENGYTALLIAYRHRKEVLVKYLLKHGAKTWVKLDYKPKEQSIMDELKDRWQTPSNFNPSAGSR